MSLHSCALARNRYKTAVSTSRARTFHGMHERIPFKRESSSCVIEPQALARYSDTERRSKALLLNQISPPKPQITGPSPLISHSRSLTDSRTHSKRTSGLPDSTGRIRSPHDLIDPPSKKLSREARSCTGRAWSNACRALSGRSIRKLLMAHIVWIRGRCFSCGLPFLRIHRE